MQTRKISRLFLALILASSAASAATYTELAERNAQRHFPAPPSYPVYGGVSIQPYAPAYPQPYPAYGYQPTAAANYAPTGYAPQAAPGGYPYGSAGGSYYPQQPGNSAMAMLPAGSNGLPSPRQVRWSYGQVNASSDPFNAWGLSTQGMYVPWSTPMSSWSNAQGWDWWRNRAGDEGPPPPLW